MSGNSAKFYDKAYSEIGNVLRGGETTINKVGWHPHGQGDICMMEAEV
jgi:hypothetical protein